jgi:hypothetical protein
MYGLWEPVTAIKDSEATLSNPYPECCQDAHRVLPEALGFAVGYTDPNMNLRSYYPGLVSSCLGGLMGC